MASIRKAKKMGTYKRPSYDKKLYNETFKQIEEVNRRLRNLERSGNYNSYASKKLFTRLDSKSLNVLQKTKKGKHITGVKITRQLTNTELRAIQKASSQFLRSATSTTKGIRKVREETKKSLMVTLNVSSDKKVTEEDIDDYYTMFGDSDFNYFADKIGASTLLEIIADAREMNASENDFITLLEQYITMNDEDIRNKAKRLYEKYVI